MEDAQASFQILRLSATSRLSHLLRTVPPSITCQAAANYDALVEWALASIIAGDGAAAAGLPTPEEVQRRDGALSLTIGCSTRHRVNPFVRVKSSLWLKIHGPSDRELAGKRQTEPVTYGHHNGGGGTFDNHPRLKNKALLFDITIVNPCAGSNLGNAARHV